jgi:2-desacetyl-2-hydroxyethyl bacteriochlorophyllide A dehydrogenase
VARSAPPRGRVVRFAAPRVVTLAEEDVGPPGPGEVLLRTLYSGISAGTELTAYRGTNPYLARRWEPERRLFLEESVTFEYPVDGWGYEEVGEVAEVGDGVTRVRAGDVVWGTWGHRAAHVVPEAWAAERLLPDGLDPLVGIFSQIAAIALNAVLDADIHVGEHVAVFGQGVPGLIVTQLATLNGGSVIAVDGIGARLDLARRLGAREVCDFTRESPAERIKDLTGGRGADVSIEISGSYAALAEAIRATAYNSRVVASGFFQGGAAALRLGEEFHHNRIEVVCAQISGVSRRLDHRWDERRLQRTAMALAAEGRLDLRPLVSHVIPADDAADAFRLLDERPGEAVQVVLDFTA